MPLQSLATTPRPRPMTARSLILRRTALVLITLVLTVAAGLAMFQAFAVGRMTLLEWVALPLFASLFAWTTFSCASAAAGFWVMLRAGPAPAEDKVRALYPHVGRNALLAPVYNEPPQQVFARLEAMLESLRAAGGRDRFDLFILSDTRDAAVAAEEEAAFARLRMRAPGQAVYYRRREENTDRKAGNIADWVRRFGAAYDHMVVLDADSLMTGDCLMKLASSMAASPNVGLIQTVPLIVNSRTLFARIEQFASRLYGPMFARGLEWWSGAESSYWGHNAIIRVRAFAEQAGLPHLSGPGAFGGSILSHDFVEAALMRRAGWEIRMAPEIGGSFEESPPTLIDQIVRDRRWCQGNLQHVGVIAARGLHPLSRFHLLRGFSAYLTAPLWFGMLSIGLLLAIFPELGGTGGSVVSILSSPALWAVLGASLAMLLAPKLMALAVVMRQGRIDAFGGKATALASVAAETAVTTLIAPIVLFAQSRAILEILAGRDSGWAAQRRDIDALSLREAIRSHRAEIVFGVVLVVLSLVFEPAAFIWVAAPALALTLAFLVSSLTARDAGSMRLLATPEMRTPPAIMLRALDLTGQEATRPTLPSAPTIAQGLPPFRGARLDLEPLYRPAPVVATLVAMIAVLP